MSINEDVIAVGGVGGSGTRVIAQMLKQSGYFTGNDLNESNDNLLFTLLFKRLSILTLNDDDFEELLELFIKSMSTNESLTKEEISIATKLASSDRILHTKEWLTQRLEKLDSNEIQAKWAWKEPNTHIIIEKLFQKMDNLKFIYVYRNGLDMAYSSNQNQLILWGSVFFNDNAIEINPKNSLKYWCLTHQRMLKLKEIFNDKVFMLDFDAMCLHPNIVLKDFLNFIKSDSSILELAKIVKAPSSIGRHKEHSLDEFDKEDLEFLSTIYKP